MKRLNTTSIFSVLLLLGILVMVNVISVRNFLRFDLTSSKMYSLSEISKEAVGSIPDRILVKAYFSPDLPSPYNTTARYLRDMLEDYRAYSKGHLTYEFIDPGSEEALEAEAQSFQIPAQTFQVVSNDKLEMKRGYMGVAFIYGDKREVIPVVQDIGNLEYEITSLIKRVTATALPKIGIVTLGYEAQQLSIQQLTESLERNYALAPVNLDEPIPADYASVLILGPHLPLTEWQLFNLDQYVMNGGKLGVFASPYQVNLQNGLAMEMDLNLHDFLANFGVTINNDMVIDVESASVPVPRRQGVFVIQTPVQIPFLVTATNLNTDNVITRPLDQLQMIFPSSVDTTMASQEGYAVDVLISSSEQSGHRWGPSVQMMLSELTADDFPEQYIPMAAVSRGIFKSAFAESGLPSRPVPLDTADGDTTWVPYDGPFVTETAGENRMLVVADGNLMLDTYIQSRAMLFMLNSADWLAQSEKLIAIRSKTIDLSPLQEVSNFTRKVVKWANQIGPVILVILLGIVLWQIRRHRKKALMAKTT